MTLDEVDDQTCGLTTWLKPKIDLINLNLTPSNSVTS